MFSALQCLGWVMVHRVMMWFFVRNSFLLELKEKYEICFHKI